MCNKNDDAGSYEDIIILFFMSHLIFEVDTMKFNGKTKFLSKVKFIFINFDPIRRAIIGFKSRMGSKNHTAPSVIFRYRNLGPDQSLF